MRFPSLVSPISSVPGNWETCFAGEVTFQAKWIACHSSSDLLVCRCWARDPCSLGAWPSYLPSFLLSDRCFPLCGDFSEPTNIYCASSRRLNSSYNRKQQLTFTICFPRLGILQFHLTQQSMEAYVVILIWHIRKQDWKNVGNLLKCTRTPSKTAN